MSLKAAYFARSDTASPDFFGELSESGRKAKAKANAKGLTSEEVSYMEVLCRFSRA
jgi:hypothetical protein